MRATPHFLLHPAVEQYGSVLGNRRSLEWILCSQCTVVCRESHRSYANKSIDRLQSAMADQEGKDFSEDIAEQNFAEQNGEAENNGENNVGENNQESQEDR